MFQPLVKELQYTEEKEADGQSLDTVAVKSCNKEASVTWAAIDMESQSATVGCRVSVSPRESPATPMDRINASSPTALKGPGFKTGNAAHSLLMPVYLVILRSCWKTHTSLLYSK